MNLTNELLEKEIDFEKETYVDIPKPQPKKLSMNIILDLILSHYRTEEEWEARLKHFVNSIADKDIREHFKRQITFFGDTTKSLFYKWGQEV